MKASFLAESRRHDSPYRWFSVACSNTDVADADTICVIGLMHEIALHELRRIFATQTEGVGVRGRNEQCWLQGTRSSSEEEPIGSGEGNSLFSSRW